MGIPPISRFQLPITPNSALERLNKFAPVKEDESLKKEKDSGDELEQNQTNKKQKDKRKAN